MPKFFRGVVPAWLTRRTRSSVSARRGAGQAAAAVLARAAGATVEALEGRKLFATTLLTNGTGDGSLSIRVDSFGSYGVDAISNGQPIALPAIYDPVGAAGPGNTTFESGVWFSGTGVANFLSEGELSTGQGNLAGVNFTTATATQAVSNFTLGGFVFQLTQTLQPITNGRSRLIQQYRVVNDTGSTQALRFVRHVDADMTFSGDPLNDFGGVSESGDEVFIFDTGTDPSLPSPFFSISSNVTRGLDTGYGIHGRNGGYFDEIDAASGIPAGDINNLIGPNPGEDADEDDNRLTDEDYDVTGSLQTDFLNVADNETIFFVTVTDFDTGTPNNELGIGPPILTFSDPTYTATEDGLFAQITVNRLGSSTQEVRVDVDVLTGGTATPGLDFTDPTTPTVLTLTIPAGQTIATFQIPINEDLVVEPDETVLLQLSNPTGGGAILGDIVAATLTIVDSTPFFGFPQSNFPISENVGVAEIPVVRSGTTFGAASVTYTVVANGTATGGADFTVVTGTLEFADGQDEAVIEIPIVLDFLREDDETFTIFLSNPTNAALGPDNATTTVTIVNFFTPPTVLDVDTVGFNNRISQIVISYSSDMDPGLVTLKTNYDLFVRKEKPLGGTVGRSERISLKKAKIEYNDVTDNVTITPAKGLKLNRFYEISVSGTRTDSPTDTDGTLFDGNADLVPGEDYRNYFGLGNKLFYYDREGDRVELETANGSILDIDRPVLRNDARVEMRDVFPNETILLGTFTPATKPAKKQQPSDNQSFITLFNSFGVTRQLPPQIIVTTPDLPDFDA